MHTGLQGVHGRLLAWGRGTSAFYSLTCVSKGLAGEQALPEAGQMGNSSTAPRRGATAAAATGAHVRQTCWFTQSINSQNRHEWL